MIIRTQVTFVAQGDHFTPSRVPADYSQAHDPGVIGKAGIYRGVSVPYGSADFNAPDAGSDQIAHVHRRAFPFLGAMREAGADKFWLHITYHHDGQCALGFSREELALILELEGELVIDCVEATSEPAQSPEQ